jgi:hypothetical protein
MPAGLSNTALLDLPLPVEGYFDGSWGDLVNFSLTNYLDIAIAGTSTFTGDGAVTLDNTAGDDTATNITANSGQYAIIKVAGTLTTTKIITVGTVSSPAVSKSYIVDNAATGGTVTFKAYGQTGISVAVGEKCIVYFNGTDFVKVASSVVDGVSTISFGSTGLTPSTATSGAVTVAGILAVANGGNGTATPTLTQGANVTITGTWPNYTIAASAPGTGTVTSVSGTGTVSGISLTGTVTSSGNLTLGGTLAVTPSNFASQTANTILAAPNGSSGTPTFRALAAADVPTLNQNTTGTAASTPLLQTTNFSISEVGGKLLFKYGATTIASMTSAGVFTTISDVVANGTP